MRKSTINKISLMRGHILHFLELANSIDFEDWILIIREVRKQKDRLKHLKDNAERGNFFILLFFLNEILHSIESP